MTETRRPTDGGTRDASDVVEGPVGSSHLKDPATSGPIGADVDDLPAIDIPDDGADGGRGAIDGPLPTTPERGAGRG
jgi:hypothetical protein